jgi:alpha-N-acetylglucosamine transferase
VSRFTYDDSQPLFPIPYPVNQESTVKRDVMLWHKLRVWNATRFEKAVVLDNDLLIRDNIDSLFAFPELSGVGQLYEGEKIVFWDPEILDEMVPVDERHWTSKTGMNGGVMVVTPDHVTYRELVESAGNSLKNRTCCPTQEFLFRHFSRKGKFTRLPLEYNARKWHKLGGKPASLFSRIKIYHFVERRKPLMIGKRECGGDVMAMEWWAVAERVDKLLDALVREDPSMFSTVLQIREAAIH